MFSADGGVDMMFLGGMRCFGGDVARNVKTLLWVAASLGCSFFSAFAQAATISTVAGDGTGDAASLIKPVVNGSLATETTAAYVQGLAFDAAGDLYYNAYPYILRRDADSGTITIVAGNGNFGFSGDGGPATSAELRGLGVSGLGFDLAGNLLIADGFNQRIRAINGAGSMLTLWGDPSFNGQLTDMEYDGGGTLFIVENQKHRIWMVPPTGGSVVFAGNAALDGSAPGDLGGGFSGDGGAATSALLDHPYGLAIDADGHVYFSDKSNHVVRRVDRLTGVITTYAGTGTVAGFGGDGGPATDALLNNPAGIDFDSAGNLYIADAWNSRVRRVDAVSGVISTVAGSGTPGFSGDGGDALNAALLVSNVALDGNDDLYLADGYRVRKVAFSDTSPPVGTVSINNGAEYATAQVALTLTCDDGGGSGCARVRVMTELSAGEWVPFSENLTAYFDPVEGVHSVTVRFEDADRNVSEASASVIVDLTKPPMPTVTTPASGAAVATASFTVAGTAEPFATLLIKRRNGSGVLLATTSADENGDWSASVGPFEDGFISVEAITVDRAGNTYGVGMPAGAQVDTTPPNVPVINTPVDGYLSSDTFLTLSGTEERTSLDATLYKSSVITLFDGETEVATVTAMPMSSTSARWSFELDSLAVGVHQFSVIATDELGNSSARSAAVAVTIDGPDTTAPVVTPPADVVIEAIASFGVYASNAEVAAFLNAASALDNLDGVVSVSHDAPNQIPLGTTTITFTATDTAGNIGMATATISITDQTPPQFILVPADLTVIADMRGEYSTAWMTFDNARASDRVDGLMTVANGKVIASVPAVLGLGITTVTYSATDAAGNSATATSTITVVDQRPPLFNSIERQLTVRATSDAGIPLAEVVNTTLIRATDEVDGDVPVTHDGPEILPVGVTTLTFRASDSAGNVATLAWLITVTALDSTPPVVTVPEDIIISAVDSTGTPRAAVADFLSSASASDAVDGALAVSNDAPLLLPIGTTVVTFSATDAAGNVGTAVAAITVADQTPPTLEVPNGLIIEGDSVLGGTSRSDTRVQAFLGLALAADDIDSSPSLTNDAPSLLPFGATSVVFTATDEAGNSVTAVATIRVNDPGLTGEDELAPSGTGLTVAQSVALGLDPNAATTDTDGDGVDDALEVGDVNAPTDQDGDGVPDLFESGSAANDASHVNGLSTSTGRVDLQSTGQQLSQVTSSATGAGAPSGVAFPFGVISYETTVATAGDSQAVRLTFSESIPSRLVLYKVDAAGTYSVIPTTQWRQVDANTVELTLTDGGPFDLDGAANGVIVDPVALGSNPAPAAVSSSSGGGGGGVSLWALMLLLPFMVYGKRGRRVANARILP